MRNRKAARGTETKTRQCLGMKMLVFTMNSLKSHSKQSGSRSSGISLDTYGTTRSLLHSSTLWPLKTSVASRHSTTTWVTLSTRWTWPLSKKSWSSRSTWMWGTGDRTSRSCLPTAVCSMRRVVTYISLPLSSRISISLSWDSTSSLTLGRMSEWLKVD